MQSNKTCQLVEQYLGYLTVIKGRSENTIKEYRTDLLMFLNFVMHSRNTPVLNGNFSLVNIDFVRSISLNDMYAFITYCQNELHAAPEESVRVLIQSQKSPRDHCIITIFLNCALRLSELGSLSLDQVDNEVIRVIGKGNKERKIFLTPAVKRSINNWLQIRNSCNVTTNALFTSRRGTRMTTRAIQNVVKKYIIASGLDPKAISAHKLRHTAATLMYKYGRVDIRSLQQILGHESVATTEIYYRKEVFM